MHIKDNIKPYFLQQCSAEDAARIAKWLEENPEAVAEYMTEAEWEAFQQTDQLSVRVSRTIWQKIRHQTYAEKGFVFYIRRWAVAASVLLVIALSWYVIKRPSVTRETPVAVNSVKRISKELVNRNKSNIPQEFKLSDGSTIELMPGSTLSYPDTFMTHERLVSLRGEAVFHVAKSKKMPFVVNSGTISTTALGTVFRVKSHKKSNHIEVELMEGRVVVKALRAGSPFKDLYLRPGETVTYNKILETGAIAQVKVPRKKADTKITVADSSNNKSNSYWFRNEPLAKVFDRFAALYHLTINYNKAELKNMTFTAKLKKEDNPDNVLRSIALLNDLKIEKTGGGYNVKKKQDPHGW